MGKSPEGSEVEHRLKTSSQMFCEWDMENFKGSIIKGKRKGRLYTECFFMLKLEMILNIHIIIIYLSYVLFQLYIFDTTCETPFSTLAISLILFYFTYFTHFN